MNYGDDCYVQVDVLIRNGIIVNVQRRRIRDGIEIIKWDLKSLFDCLDIAEDGDGDEVGY